LSLKEFKKQNNFEESVLNITKNTFKHILIAKKLEQKEYR
jgi:hypothetical protein